MERKYAKAAANSSRVPRAKKGGQFTREIGGVNRGETGGVNLSEIGGVNRGEILHNTGRGVDRVDVETAKGTFEEWCPLMIDAVHNLGSPARVSIQVGSSCAAIVLGTGLSIQTLFRLFFSIFCY